MSCEPTEDVHRFKVINRLSVGESDYNQDLEKVKKMVELYILIQKIKFDKGHRDGLKAHVSVCTLNCTDTLLFVVSVYTYTPLESIMPINLFSGYHLKLQKHLTSILFNVKNV